jgi:hypothetical protein
VSSTTSLEPTKIDSDKLEALERVWKSVKNAAVIKEGKGIRTLDKRDAYADIKDCILKGKKYKDVSVMKNEKPLERFC